MFPWRKHVSRAVGLAVAGLAIAAIAAALAPFGWPFELFAHFRWQLGVAAAALLAAALAVRRPWMAVIAFAVLTAQGLPVLLPARAASAHDATAACGGEELRVVTANALFTNDRHEELIDWLARSDADVIALQEITPAWATSLAKLSRAYPYHRVIARSDPYGIAIFSRWPARGEMAAVDLAGDGLPSLVATLEVRDRTVRLFALHTRWPVVRDLQSQRDLALREVARLAASGGVPTILAGDLNLTPYAPAFAQLVKDSGLRDALDDVAWRPTWQAGFWPLALPIDHVLVPRDACVVAHEIGPNVGSDHRPLRVTLRLP